MHVQNRRQLEPLAQRWANPLQLEIKVLSTTRTAAGCLSDLMYLEKSHESLLLYSKKVEQRSTSRIEWDNSSKFNNDKILARFANKVNVSPLGCRN